MDTTKTSPKAQASAHSDDEDMEIVSLECQVLIIGKTGNGKSSVGNTLLGTDQFQVGSGMWSTTQKAQPASASEGDKTIKVLDTPDISEMSTDDSSAEINQWKELISPGPDVILLAVRCDVRYTAEEHAIYKQLKKAWGNDAAFCERLVLAFTFGDKQDEDIETELKTVCPELQSVLKDARHRYVLFNNLASKEERKSMAAKLFEIFTTGPSTSENTATSTAERPTEPNADKKTSVGGPQADSATDFERAAVRSMHGDASETSESKRSQQTPSHYTSGSTKVPTTDVHPESTPDFSMPVSSGESTVIKSAVCNPSYKTLEQAEEMTIGNESGRISAHSTVDNAARTTQKVERGRTRGHNTTLSEAESGIEAGLRLARAQTPPGCAGETPMDTDHAHRILIIGKSGHGKSSLGNILLGREQFLVGTGMTSTTTQTEVASAGEFEVIDTAAISFNDDPEGAREEIAKWTKMTSPKPYAILLAVNCEEMYTREKYNMYERLKAEWGDESFSDHLVVAFTFGDSLDHDINEELKGVSSELKNVLKDAGNRFVVFNAKASQDDKKEQTRRLLGVIKQKGPSTSENTATSTAERPTEPNADKKTSVGGPQADSATDFERAAVRSMHGDASETSESKRSQQTPSHYTSGSTKVPTTDVHPESTPDFSMPVSSGESTVIKSAVCNPSYKTLEQAEEMTIGNESGRISAHSTVDNAARTTQKVERGRTRGHNTTLSEAESGIEAGLRLARAQTPPGCAGETPMDTDHAHRILIIGKSGHGKSSLGNILLGREQFLVGTGMTSTTTQTEVASAGEFEVIDTAAISFNDDPEGAREEIAKWTKMTSPKPYAILLAVNCEEMYTREKYNMYERLKAEWGDESFSDHLVVAFTFGDSLDHDINEELKGVSSELKNVLKDAGNRFVVFNAKASQDDKKEQTRRLLGVIKQKAQASVLSDNEDMEIVSPATVSEYQVLIIGKTGNGKSSVGNTLLGTDQFQVGSGMWSTTQKAQPASASEGDKTIKVLDTPDISEMSTDDSSAEINQWKELISPGPDVILLAVRCDVRYTAEEHAIYKQLKKAWGNDAAFCERLVLAFTFGDKQDEDIETELKTVCPELQSVLKDARHRYVLFNNLASKEERKSMAAKLFEIFTTGPSTSENTATSTAERPTEPNADKKTSVGGPQADSATDFERAAVRSMHGDASETSESKRSQQTPSHYTSGSTKVPTTDVHPESTPDFSMPVSSGESTVIKSAVCNPSYKTLEQAEEMTIGNESGRISVHITVDNAARTTQKVERGRTRGHNTTLSEAESGIEAGLRLARAQTPPGCAGETPMDTDHAHRILIIGKSGHGKSSLGNILLGREQFLVGTGMTSTTTQTEVASAGEFEVIDTAAISFNDDPEGAREEIAKWTKMTSPKPYAILLAVNCEEMYTREKYNMYERLKAEWGDESFSDHLVVAFTFGDSLDHDINEELKGVSSELKNVLKDAGNRFVVFNAKASQDDKKEQTRRLLGVIKQKAQASVLSDNEGMEIVSPATVSEYQVLIIGKTGNGKSSVGNTLLGTDQFQVGSGMWSTTQKAQLASASEGDKTIKVLDTPDISEMSTDDSSAEINQWKELIPPGPDVILLAVRCDVRYTAEEHAIYKQLKKAWGNDAAFCERLVLAFTFGDKQDEDIETELKTVCPELQSVLKDARHRYVLFNNLASKEERKSMATKLFEIFTMGAGSIPRVRKATGHAGDGPEPKMSAEGFYGDTKARGDANVQPVMDTQQRTSFRCPLV